MPTPPYRFSDTKAQVTAAPVLGEHNKQIFVDMLGLDSSHVDTLMREGSLA
jgi:hypothetical protein